MSGFYTLGCKDKNGWYAYYFFYSPRTIRNTDKVLTSGYAPDAMRMVVEEREDVPIGFGIVNPFKYLYYKYFKNVDSFRYGYRVNWEKENKKLLDK